MEELNFFTLLWLHSIPILSWNPISLQRYNLHYYLVWVDFLLLFPPSLSQWSHLLFGKMIKKTQKALKKQEHFTLEREDQIHAEKSKLSWVGNFLKLWCRGLHAYESKTNRLLSTDYPPSPDELSPTVQVMKLFFQLSQRRSFLYFEGKGHEFSPHEATCWSPVSIVPSHLSHQI